MTTRKYQLLVQNLAAELGIEEHLLDFKTDFINTTHRYNNKTNTWKSTLKNPPAGLPPLAERPITRYGCYCETCIIWNCLIQHKLTGRYFFVGNICIRYLGVDMRKRCVECNEINHKHTSRCGDCRIECPIHKEYHDDNRQCTRPISNHSDHDESEWSGYEESYIDEDPAYLLKNGTIRYSKSKIEPVIIDPMDQIIRYGKHRGQSYAWIKSNDIQYLKWMARTIETENWIKEHI